MDRSVVAYWGTDDATVARVVGEDVARWPVDDEAGRRALVQHLHVNWEVRVVWVYCPAGADLEPYRTLSMWWNGVDNGASHLSTRDYGDVVKWVHLDVAYDVVLGERGAGAGEVRDDLRRQMEVVEDLMSPRR
jgi:hypothetical protein